MREISLKKKTHLNERMGFLLYEQAAAFSRSVLGLPDMWLLTNNIILYIISTKNQYSFKHINVKEKQEYIKLEMNPCQLS